MRSSITARFVAVRNVVFVPIALVGSLSDGVVAPIDLAPAILPPEVLYPDSRTRAPNCVVLRSEDIGDDGVVDNRTRITYESSGRIQEEALDSNADGIFEAQAYYFYDENGNLIQIQVVGAEIDRYIYDAAGRLIITSRWKGGRVVWRDTLHYDREGRLVKVVQDFNGDGVGDRITTWTAGDLEWVGVATSNPGGRAAATERRILHEGRVVLEEFDVLSNGSVDSSHGYRYDAMGRLLEVLTGQAQPTGVAYRYEYRDDLVVTMIANPDSTSADVTYFYYDDSDRLTEAFSVDHVERPRRARYDYSCE